MTIEATPDGSTLTILHADPTDGGTYTCTAVNTVGKFLPMNLIIYFLNLGCTFKNKILSPYTMEKMDDLCPKRTIWLPRKLDMSALHENVLYVLRDQINSNLFALSVRKTLMLPRVL